MYYGLRRERGERASVATFFRSSSAELKERHDLSRLGMIKRPIYSRREARVTFVIVFTFVLPGIRLLDNIQMVVSGGDVHEQLLIANGSSRFPPLLFNCAESLKRTGQSYYEVNCT
jgi:hypothetical protein